MARNWWRLLAAFLLILVAALLRGQNASADQVPIPGPDSELLLYRPITAGSISPSAVLPERPAFDGRPIDHSPLISGPFGILQMAQPAGIIFSGTVTAIAQAATSKGVGSNAVTFNVEHAIRGASEGQSLTIHEWAGLWQRGERYRVGEHVFLFLYSPSKLGLTSPVSGGMGRFSVASTGKVLFTPQQIHLLVTDPILGGKTAASYGEFVMAIQRVGPRVTF